MGDKSITDNTSCYGHCAMVNNEPTYHYIKGQGWVASVEQRVLAKTRDGKDVWIIDRQARPGEYWVNKALDTETIEQVIEHVLHFKREAFIYKWDLPAGSYKTWTLIFI